MYLIFVICLLCLIGRSAHTQNTRDTHVSSDHLTALTYSTTYPRYVCAPRARLQPHNRETVLRSHYSTPCHPLGTHCTCARLSHNAPCVHLSLTHATATDRDTLAALASSYYTLPSPGHAYAYTLYGTTISQHVMCVHPRHRTRL